MKEIMTQIFCGIVAIATIIGIKVMDLPGVISALLVLITVLVAVFGMAGGFSKTSLKKRTEEKESSIHPTVFTTTKKI